MRRIYFLLILLLPLLVSSQHLSDEAPAETDTENFSLYPNPAFGDVVYITTEMSGPKVVAIYDVFGKMVFRESLLSPRIDISKLDPGVYLIQLTIDNSVLTRKLIVK